MENPTIKDFITSLDDVLRAHPQETLGQVLLNVRSSHEPIFIFDGGSFHGLLSPYTVLYKKRLPHDTKLKSEIFHPPHVTENTSLDQLSNHMISSRLYTLPVYDEEGQLIGKVRLDDVLQGLKRNREVFENLASGFEIRSPITADEDSAVRDVYSTLRNRKISRIPLVTNTGILTGIVSRRDLMNAFMMPTQKERFSKLAERTESFSFDEEKVYRQDLPVKHFYKPGVHYVDERESKQQMLRELIDSDFNSLIIVNGEAKPTGIFSYRNVLEALSKLSPKEKIPISYNRPSENVSKAEWEKSQELIDKLLRKLEKQIDIRKVELHVDESKSPAEHTRSFNVHLKITPVKGKNLFAEAKEVKFVDAIHEVIKGIGRLERKEKTRLNRKSRKSAKR